MTDLPCAAPEPAPLPAPSDTVYPGELTLRVDATDVERGILRVRELIPVRAAGPLTLLYPKWLPGYHSPQAPIELFAGLEIQAAGKPLDWKRDPVEVHAFHLEVPAGVDTIEAQFQFLSPTTEKHGRLVVTRDILTMQWNTVVLYPAGHYSRRIQVQASVELPPGWAFACPLERGPTTGSQVAFAPVSLDVLIDSPLYAGRHLRAIPLDEQGLVRLNLVAERPDQLEASPTHLAPHRALIAQADKLFGPRPFDHYDFLVSLSDELGSVGVEHHRCAEIGTVADYFTKWDSHAEARDVMAHEYVHAWNGKYRRGKDSWTPSFERPIQNSLMWVYEGQTQYWGNVLSARSGLVSVQHALDALARTAAVCEHRAGRRWRSMSDTTRDPIIASRGPLPWVSWQRSEDYYSEGQLMWLEVDTLLRELTDDTRSLDTFARAFFGTADGRHITSTYDFDEVVRTLAAIAPYDWASYFVRQVDGRGLEAPLAGLLRGGYQLVYRSTPSALASQSDAARSVASFHFSIGVVVAADGTLQEVLWDSPAFDAGLTVGMQVAAVNGRSYGADELTQAIVAAQHGEPIDLLVRRGKAHRTAQIAYRGGLRYPHLEPIAGARRRLEEILAAR